MSEVIAKFGYKVQCRCVTPTLPGTAVVWKSGLKVGKVNQLIERRVQSVSCCGETFINVYAPSGSVYKRERWEMFNELAVFLLDMGRVKLPTMMGDWNCVLAEVDTANNFPPKYCKVLHRIVQTLEYQDCFRLLHPRTYEYTFHRGPHMAQSRLDRGYLPPHLVNGLMSAKHAPGVSDHSHSAPSLLPQHKPFCQY